MSSSRTSSADTPSDVKESFGPTAEAEVLEAIQDKAADLGWKPENLDQAQLGQPDLVLRGPDGRLVLLELLLGRGDLFFTAIAQVDTLAGVLGHGHGAHEVRPFIVTTRNVPQSVQEAAREIGVGLVADSDRRQLVDLLLDSLQRPW